jgi:hypothetical protein
MMETNPTTETLCFLNTLETMQNVQYMYVISSVTRLRHKRLDFMFGTKQKPSLWNV